MLAPSPSSVLVAARLAMVKWKYADLSTSDGTIPTMKELNDTCIAHLREKKPEALECELQKWMKGKSYEWLWTPAYCPWLQPM